MKIRLFAKTCSAGSSSIFALLLLLAGCATSTAPESPVLASRQAELLRGDSILQGEPLPTIPEKDILALDADALAFIEKNVNPDARRRVRLDELLAAVVEDAGFGLNYDGHTRTATETFHRRNGNCLAFTNMFVAMARSVGLDAKFQEVDIPPVWDRVGDTIVLNRHINVNVRNIDDDDAPPAMFVWGKRDKHDRVIDFNIAEFRTFYHTRLISDERAFAHFYSNLAVEELRDGHSALALAYLRTALAGQPGFAAAWTNLGVLYSRSGDLPSAKAAYEMSLHYDPENVTTTSNLASVERRLGDTERAAVLMAEVEKYRNRSPYFRYHMATEAVGRGDYEAALGHLRYAVRKQPREERFHFALSVVYAALGDQEKSETELSNAKALAADPSHRQRYDDKLRQLRIDAEETRLGG